MTELENAANAAVQGLIRKGHSPERIAEILAADTDRKPHRQICSLCHEVDRVSFFVPDDVWALAVHISQINSLICLSCFTRLADERGVEWDKEIQFHPVSRVTQDRWLRDGFPERAPAQTPHIIARNEDGSAKPVSEELRQAAVAAQVSIIASELRKEWQIAPDCLSPSQDAAILSEGGAYVCRNCQRYNAPAQTEDK